MEVKTTTTEDVVSLTCDITLGLVAFSIPFFISGPQLITGSIVNALLFIAVIKLPVGRLLPVIVLPSLGAFLRGVLFGPLTIFLFYFLPFIWIGNSILMFVFSRLKEKVPVLIRVIVAAGLKSLFLFAVANVYFKFHIVPKVFLNSMGIIQLTTATLGGLLAQVTLKLITPKYD